MKEDIKQDEALIFKKQELQELQRRFYESSWDDVKETKKVRGRLNEN